MLPPGHSTARLLQALLKAARDPRIVGVCLKISPLQAGWAKLQELRQYIKYFRCTSWLGAVCCEFTVTVR